MLSWLFSSKPSEPRAGIDLQNMDGALTREMSAILARAGVPTFRQSLARLRGELDRARRYDRPLTLAVIGDARVSEPSPGDLTFKARVNVLSANPPSPLGPGSPLIPVVIASVLTEVLRDVDIVTYAAALGRCVVAMPELTGEQAQHAMKRVGELCAHRLMVPVQARVAVFRQDGLTLEELIRHAMDVEENARPVPVPVPQASVTPLPSAEEAAV